MEKKKILIVSLGFYPQISPRSFRSTELAKEFARQGHEVTVLTSFDNDLHDEFGKKHKVFFKDLGIKKWSPVEIKGGFFVKTIRRAVSRALLMFFEYPDIEIMPMVTRALKKEQGHDLLISIAVPYPVHWGVANIWTKKRKIAKKWVADCGDPYMGDEIDTFRKFFYFKYVEKWFMRKADFVTIPVATGIKGYYPEFHKKIRIIPQGFNIEEIKLPTEPINNKPISFAYAGDLGPKRRDPRPFLEYLSTLESDFRFVIFTKKTELVLQFKEKLKDKLEVRNYLDRNELLEFLATMDFLVNFDNISDTHVPSKLIDYAFVKRPILNIGTTFDKKKVCRFLNGDYSGQLMVENPEQYNIKNVAKRFLELLNE